MKLRKIFLYFWVSPITLVGVFCGLFWLCLGGRLQRTCAGVEFYAPYYLIKKIQFPYEAITLGHVVVCMNCHMSETVRRHEWVHIEQYERYGVLFPLLYFSSGLYAALQGKHFYWDNAFEVQARSDIRQANASNRFLLKL